MRRLRPDPGVMRVLSVLSCLCGSLMIQGSVICAAEKDYETSPIGTVSKILTKPFPVSMFLMNSLIGKN
jgi:hypothetical protein